MKCTTHLIFIIFLLFNAYSIWSQGATCQELVQKGERELNRNRDTLAAIQSFQEAANCLLEDYQDDASEQNFLRVVALQRQLQSSTVDDWSTKLIEIGTHCASMQAFGMGARIMEDLNQPNRFAQDQYKLMPAYRFQAYLYESAGRFYQASNSYEQAWSLVRSPYSYIHAFYNLRPLANCYTRQGENEKAITYLEQAIDITRKDTNPSKPLWVLLYLKLDLGIAQHDQNQTRRALQTIDEALSVINSLPPDVISVHNPANHGVLSIRDAYHRLLNEKATLLSSGDRNPKDIQKAKQIAQSLEAQTSLNQDIKVNNLMMLGEIEAIELSYPTRGNSRDSNAQVDKKNAVFDYLNKAQQQAEDNLQSRDLKRELGKVFISQGDAHLQFEEWAEAQVAYKKAIQSVLPHLAADAKVSDIDTAFLYSENVLLDAFTGLVNTTYLQYQDKFNTIDRATIEEALANIQLALKTEEKFLESFTFESSSLQLLEDNKERHSIYLDFLHELSTQSSKSFTDFKEITFEIFERSKSFLFKRQFNLNAILQVLDKNSDDYSLLQQLLEAQASLSSISVDLASLGKNTGAEYQQIRQEKLAATQRQQVLFQLAVDRIPALRSLSGNSTISLKNFQNKLGRREEAILYFYGVDYLYILGISKKNTPIFKKVPLAEIYVEGFLSLFNSSVNQNNKSKDTVLFIQYQELGHQLHQRLIASVLSKQKVKHLLLFPDEELFKLPFELLPNYGSNYKAVPVGSLPGSYNKLPYLFRDYELSYAHSASTYLTKEDNNRTNNPFIGIVPEYNPRTCKLRPMKASSTQLIRQLSKINNGIFSDSAKVINDSSFIQSLQRSEQIVFYGHFVYDSIASMNSYLALSCIDAAKRKMSLYEMVPILFNADLFYVAACESGIGKISPGEGVQNLERILLSNGVKNTVTTLWKVEDDPTNLFTKAFFEALDKQKSYNEALNYARETILEEYQSYAHPFYWGAFTLNKASPMGPASEAKSEPWFWVLAVCLLVLVSYWFFSKR